MAYVFQKNWGSYCFFTCSWLSVSVWSSVGVFSCEPVTGTLVKIAVKLPHVLRSFLQSSVWSTHALMQLSQFPRLACGRLFFYFSRHHRTWMTCVQHFSPPTSPLWKMAAKEQHQVLSTRLDIHLGNSNGAIIMAWSSGCSSCISLCFWGYS